MTCNVPQLKSLPIAIKRRRRLGDEGKAVVRVWVLGLGVLGFGEGESEGTGFFFF